MRIPTLAISCTALIGFLSCQTLSAQFTVLHSFTGADQFGDPDTTLVEVSPGTFIGTCGRGVFRVTSSGEYGDIVDFEKLNLGANSGPLTPASNGLYFGVANAGEPSYVYSVSAAGQTITIVNSSLLYAGNLTEAADGQLWGTTETAAGSGEYALFKMSLSGEVTLVAEGLTGPFAGPPLQASDGNFYGVSFQYAGTASNLYRITPSGETTLLHTFPTGETSVGGLVQASNGVIYGTAVFEAQPSCTSNPLVGQIFSVTLSGEYKRLQGMRGCPSAGVPYGLLAGLVEASDGFLYGSTAEEGFDTDGTVFKIRPDGSGFQNNLVVFNYNNGALPNSDGPALVQGSDGALYGTASSGGAGQAGIVFQIDRGLTPPLPSVQLFAPQSGSAGSTIRLKGDHLIGLSGVSFNGVAAAFTAVNVNFAYAVVPAGAASGPITVTTMNGSYTTAASFTIQ